MKVRIFFAAASFLICLQQSFAADSTTKDDIESSVYESGDSNAPLPESAGSFAPSEPSESSYAKPERAMLIDQLWNTGKNKAAFRELDKWMDEDPKSPDPYLEAASLYFRKGEFKKCLKMGQKALDKSPQSGEAYFWRGRAFENLGKPIEAANEYRAALYAKNEYFPAKQELDRLLVQLSPVEEE